MKKINLIIFTLLILIIALGTAIYLKSRPATEEKSVSIPPPPAEPIKKPIVHYPVPEVKPTPAQQNQVEQPQAVKKETKPPLPAVLPKVEESDQSIDQALASLFSGQELYKLFFMENFIQRIVATVDNLPEKQLPRAHLPIKPPAGAFFVAGTADAPQTSSRNQKRYAPYVSLLESVNQDKAIKIYVHFYPLFQKAYEQLGYKNAYFNDRLVYVIDHLLAVPNPADPILLAQPGVLYTYADPLLERRSAGQKLLLRIGREQRLKVLKILNGYRQKLTNLKF